MRKSVFNLFLCSILIFMSTNYLTADENSSITLQTKTFSYVLDTTGQNISFMDKATGTDYLATSPDVSRACAQIEQGGQIHACNQATFDQGALTLTFADSDVQVTVAVESQDRFLMFTVKEVNGEPDALTFFQIPLTVQAKPDETFGACALSMNLQTEVKELPALMSRLSAHCYKRFGLTGAKAAIVAVPMTDILPSIRESLQAGAEFPLSDSGGAWALDAPEGYGSYMMNFGTLTEQTVDTWIQNCKNFGFNQIDNHGGSRYFFTFGCFELNPDLFPEGWNSYKKIVDRLHEAGISSIFHTYAMYISTDSRYVRPTAHPDLDVLAHFTLAEPITADATELVVQESPEQVSLETGYMNDSNNVLRLDGELIHYTGITKETPYRFTGCERGFHGTTIETHAAGSSADILRTFWGGLYVPAPDSALFNEIAARTAEVVDMAGFDGIYFDAIEGVRSMWGSENYWYYGDKFVFEVMKNLKKPVGVEYAGMVHHWWHYRSRYQAWDSPTRGYKRFIDTHLASMKAGDEPQHGCWNGNLPEIIHYGSMAGSSIFLPLHLGWWTMPTGSNVQHEALYCDDMEYVCGKMIGNNAGLSINISIDSDFLERTPAVARLATMVRRYEEFRHGNYFNDAIREQLRQVGDDFTLIPQENGSWNFKPVHYDKHLTTGLDSESAAWSVQNEYDPQQVKFRLEILTSAGSYEEETSQTILTPETPNWTVTGGQTGITGTLQATETLVPATGEKAMSLIANSDGSKPQDESWLTTDCTLENSLDLSEAQALGVWIHGDGRGEVLDFRTWSATGFEANKSSHLVKIDFTGWRYCLLVEADSTEMSNYCWPETGGYYVYDHYRGSANYKNIKVIQVWLNNIPGNGSCEVLLGPVKALRTYSGKVENPVLTVNGQSIALPVTMESNMYLELGERGTNEPFVAGEEYTAPGNRPFCRVFNPAGVLVTEFSPEGELPELRQGKNEFILSGTTPLGPVRARTTIITTGPFLK